MVISCQGQIFIRKWGRDYFLISPGLPTGLIITNPSAQNLLNLFSKFFTPGYTTSIDPFPDQLPLAFWDYLLEKFPIPLLAHQSFFG